ncbi:MAG: glycosyltransferase family 4 protein, partial [Elusimicrobia bacterium]|nr:glycosyltransferase family 4 protein [Elusimicrobiota bacterium]
HVVTRLDLGGAQQNTLYTVAHLDRSRFEPVLACGAGGLLDAEARALPLRVRFVEDLVRQVDPLRDLAALLQLAALMREEEPDVVHTHSSKAGILGRAAAVLAGVPAVVHTFHGFGFHDRMSPPARALYVALERLAARASDRLVFVSKANMEEARSRGVGDPDRYELIRSGVALAGLPARVDREAKRRELGVRLHAPLVCGVGNLKPQKNAEDFVRAAAEVLRLVPEACFVYVGDGPLRSRVQALAVALGLSARLRLVGWRRDAAEILAASDAFLLTSLWEGLPRALVEAMKTGLPCACYAVDGVRDLLVDGVNGVCAPAGDWRRLAEGLARILSDPALRARLGTAAAASVGPEFDIDAMVRAQERMLD